MAELDPDEVAAPEAKTVDTAPVTAPEAPPVPEAPVSLRDPAVEIPPLLKRPAVVEQDPAEANLDAIPVSPREQAKKEAAATITEFNAGKRPELTQDQLQNLELIAADDKTGYDRMYDALWEGVKDVPDVIKAAKEWATRPHQPTPEEEEKIRTRREELIASGHSTIQAEQEAEREFRREATERGARELAQGGLMAGVGLPSFVQDIGVGTGDVLSSPLQVLPGIGPYIKGNIARNRAQADILKHHSERLASWIAEKTGVSRDTAASMFGENMAYMLLPGSELATAADMSRAIKAGLSYSRGLTGTAAEVAKGVLAKSAPVLEKGVKTAGAAVAGGAFDTIVKSVTGFDTHHLGAWLTGEGALLKLARSSPEITDKIYKSVTDMPASEFAKKSFEIAREKPLGQPINDFLGDFSRQKAVARSQEADALKATMKPADVVAASDKAVDGTWKIQDDNLTPEAKKLRTVLDDVSDLHNKADIAYRQGKLSKLLEFGANVSGNVAAHTAQAGLLGAAFTGPSATTGEAGPAVGTGMAVGAVLGTGAAPLTVPAGMRAGRLKAGDIALFNRGKDKIRGDISVLNPDDQRRMVKYAGFLDSMGATLHVHSPDELRAMQGLPASASPGAGFVSENGKDVYLNSDSIPRGGGNIPGVEAHEFTHVTERFLGETLRKLAPEHMKEFETQYGQALNTTGQTGFNSRSERDAEVGRLVLQNTPIDYFYGGATGGDIIKDRLSRIFGGMLGKNGVKTINGFEAPYTPRDILDMRKRFLKAGEAASREGVTPSAADHKTWSPDQQNIVKQWTKSYVDKGMSPNDAANKVAEDIQSITKGPPPEPEPEEPHVSTGAPAGPAQKPDNVDWINFPEEKPYYKEGGFSYMPEKVKPITKEEARGNSRPVAQDEFDKLAEIGQRKLASLQKDPSPPTGLDDNWNNIKQNTWLKAQADWGGDTIDAHTGKSVTPAEKSGPFSLTVREPGQDSVVIPQDATQEQFNKAMDTARQRFGKQLSYKDHHLGVFHDNDKGTIDIDPVLVVKNAGDVQTIGAYTHAVGGAFDYATGNGYFPPHVDPSLPSLIGKRTGAGGVWDSTFVSGEGEEMRQDLAKQLGANPDKHFYEQKPAVQKAITEHFKDTGEAQYMPQVKDFQDLAKDAGYEFQGDLDGVLFWKNKEGKEITAEPWRGRASAIQDFKDKLSGKYEAGQDLSKYSKSQAYGLYGERSRLKREGETQFMPSPAGELNWTRRQYDMTPDQLEQFLVFGKSVAGKRSAIQAPMIERFMTDLLDKHGGTSPLAALQKAAQEPGGIEELVRKHKFSPYESSIPFLKHLAENRIPDLRNITEEELQNIPHIGPKTARFFKMHTDATRANNVALDTHILSWLRDNGFGDAPKSTPQDPATYQLWSDKFRDAAKELGTTPNDLDLRIWLDRSGNLPKETYQQLKSIGASRQFMPEKDDYRGYIMRTPLHEHVSRVGGIDEPRIYVANTKEPSEPFKGTYQHLTPIGKGQENVSFLNPKVIAHVQGGVPYLRAMAKEAQAQGHDGLVILSKNAALPADVDQVGLGHYPEAKKAFYMNDKDFAEWAKKNPDKLDWENPRNVYVPLEGPQSSMAERAAAQNAHKQPFKETPTQKFRRQIRETGEPRPEDRAGEWWKKEGGTPFEDLQFMPNPHPEAIVSAAVKNEKGEIFLGGSHGMAYSKAIGKKLISGYVTRDNQFLDPKQALEHAKRINQTTAQALTDARMKVWGLKGEPSELESRTFNQAQKAQFMPNPHPEAINADEPAAIRTPDGKIHTGKWHPSAFANMTEKYSAEQLGKWAKQYGEKNYFEDGFVNNKREFKTRQESRDIVERFKQMTPQQLEKMDSMGAKLWPQKPRPLEALRFRSAMKEQMAPKQTFADKWEGPRGPQDIQHMPSKKTPKQEFEEERARHAPQIELANKLATAAHAGQKRDFTGEEYMQHPTQVAELVKDELKPAALLHDAVEDGKTTLDALRKKGIGEDTLNTIEALTRRPNETYAKYIDRLKDNPNARDIKVADLYNNLQTLPRDSTLKSRYVKALNTMVPTDAQMRYVLKEDQKDMVGAHRDQLKAGDPVALRIDIPAYLKHGKYAVTVHEGKKVGPRMGYDGIATVDNPNFFVQEAGAQRVATGGSHKFPMAAVGGDFNPSRVLPHDIGDYSMVGMNPMKHSYFYEKGTGQPVIGGDQAISVGNSVFVKNPIYGKKEDFRYMPESPAAAKAATEKAAREFPEAKELKWKLNEHGEVQMYPIKDKKTGKVIGEEARPAEEGYNLANQYLAKKAAEGIKGKAQQHEAKTDVGSDKIVNMYHTVKDNPEVMQAKGWYRELRDKLSAKLGGKMSDLVLFTRLLATTSPNTNPGVNFGFALDAWNRFKRGEYKDVIERYQDALQRYDAGTLTHSDGKAVTTHKQWEGYLHGNDIIPYGSGFHETGPRKGQPKKLGMHSLRVLDVLSGHYDRIKGLKINQFAHNLAQTDLKATIDLWAARTIHRLLNEGNKEPWRILPQNEKGISDADFKFGQDVFGKAAKKLGIATDDLQAIMWFAEKIHYDKQGWSRNLDKGDFRPLVESMKPTGGGTFSYTPPPPKPKSKAPAQPFL